MKIIKKIFLLLQRVTSSGEKLLYIDGLRFFAVMSVFLFHFIDYYKDHHSDFESYTKIGDYMEGSVIGVILFFSISGFLIAMPFYNYHILRIGFSLKNYYFRRLTRLEPPYMIHLFLLFLFIVFIFKTKTFAETFPHFLASVFYCHEIIYREKPLLNTVLWTLEIEIQFYVIAPLLAIVFLFRSYIRRTFILLLIFVFMYWRPVQLGFPTVFQYLSYFLTGFLAFDVYMELRDKRRKQILFDVLCIVSIILLWFSTTAYITLILLYILLVYSSKTFLFIRILENKIIYTIGGMCYTIYMLHQKLIHLVPEKLLSGLLIGNNYLVDLFVRLAYTLVVTLLVSSFFFILVERPTMKKKWWKYKSLKELILK